MIRCGRVWATHRCDLPVGHLGVHQCSRHDPDPDFDPCSQFTDVDGYRRRDMLPEGRWTLWYRTDSTGRRIASHGEYVTAEAAADAATIRRVLGEWQEPTR